MAKPIDLTGQRFGRLVAIKKAFSKQGAWWECQCDCGVIRNFVTASLRDGSSSSCGCSRLKNITGQKFNYLTVLSRAENLPNSRATRWNCLCDCGNTKVINGSSLKSGRTTSCGCFVKKINTTHGYSKHPLFQSWQAMVKRCINKKDPAYKNYGGRGISVCEEWLHSPNQFIADMNPRPLGLELDRIDNNKGYSKENCKWSTRKEQCTNRRSTILITFNNQTNSILEWSRITGINRRTITQRLSKNWNLERVFTPAKYPK